MDHDYLELPFTERIIDHGNLASTYIILNYDDQIFSAIFAVMFHHTCERTFMSMSVFLGVFRGSKEDRKRNKKSEQFQVMVQTQILEAYCI